MVYRQSAATLARLAERRIEILQGAIEMADVVGLDEGFNINQVCKYAGVATGTVYLHFVNRDELVASIVAHCTQEDTKTMRGACETETVPMKQLARALQAFITIYTSTRNLHPALMARESYRRAIMRTFSDIITECDDDHSQYAEMLALAMVGALHTALQSQTNPSRPRLAALMEAVLRIADVTPATYRAQEHDRQRTHSARPTRVG